MGQNISHAVMSQRVEPHDSLDFFPTPPWATRALMRYVIGTEHQKEHVWEPACGGGAMAKPLLEHFGQVSFSDVHDYGFRYGEIHDFLFPHLPYFIPDACDWVITNPPFALAEEFIGRAKQVSTVGCAILVRTVFLESVGRYNRLFAPFPPTQIAFFSERVPMVKGRLDIKASTATSYAWIVWMKAISPQPPIWIPPCRKALELAGDYDNP